MEETSDGSLCKAATVVPLMLISNSQRLKYTAEHWFEITLKAVDVMGLSQEICAAGVFIL